MPPLAPMLARAVTAVPDPGSDGAPAGGWGYEPKWDGFRCVVFRDGPEVVLGSRNERPLTRYFPELVEELRTALPERCVVDGEIVVAVDGHLSFPRLQERIHPAQSRVAMLAARDPARYVAFDLVALGDLCLLERPFGERRHQLEQVLPSGGSLPPDRSSVHRTPITYDVDQARRWFVEVEGAGLDGLVAKALDAGYTPGRRTMLKIKHARTADVVVAGYRLHKTSTAEHPLLGSLLLGLYDGSNLQHVGVAASFPMQRRGELHEALQPMVVEIENHPWGDWARPTPDSGRRPGAVSRWSTGKDLSFVPLAPSLVCEVSYDAMEGTRFRHTTHFKRWRPDRDPTSCTFEQLERPVEMGLRDVLVPKALDAT